MDHVHAPLHISVTILHMERTRGRENDPSARDGQAGMDFVLIGRGAILHHDYPKRVSTPAPRDSDPPGAAAVLGAQEIFTRSHCKSLLKIFPVQALLSGPR